MNIRELENTFLEEWPEEASDIIQKALQDPATPPEDRLLAAEMAGEIIAINDALVDVLLGILRDSGAPEDLRGQAAISLGPVLELADEEEFMDPDEIPITEETFARIKSTLHALYEDAGIPKGVRRRILEGAVRSGEDWQVEAIREAYTSGDRDWVLTAVFGMQYHRGFEDAVIESLEHPDAEIRYHAITAAGNWELDAAWPYVEELLRPGKVDKELRLAALEAAPFIRPLEAPELIVPFLDDEDEDIAEAASEAMGMAEVAGLMDDAEYEEEVDDEEEDEEEDEKR